MKATEFLHKHEEKLQKNIAVFNQLQGYFNTNQIENYNKMIGKYISNSEKLTIDARKIPELTGVKSHGKILEKAISEAHDIKISLTDEGFVNIKMPCLLPGKASKNKKEFVFFPLLYAITSFAKTLKSSDVIVNSVIAIRHIYSENKSMGIIRDNDNVDTKIVVDIIKSSFLFDDNGLICSHFYDSKFGNDDMTDIYVLPREDFSKWWEIYS